MSDCDILSSVYPSVLNGQDCCKLAGVICEQLGKRVITSLTFVGYGSFIGGQNPGSIPTQIGLLTALTLLDIRNTNFTGTIPTEIGNLGQLKSLRISSNALSSVEGYAARVSGTIPTEIGRLQSLESLMLSGLNLSSEIPTQMGTLLNLTSLELGYNALSGPIPREIGNLTKLNYLGLGLNSLSGQIPKKLGSLGRLSYLSLGNNVLSGPIPSEIGYLTGLNVLNLSNNNLSGVVPDELYSLALKPSNMMLQGNPLLEYNIERVVDISSQVDILTMASYVLLIVTGVSLLAFCIFITCFESLDTIKNRRSFRKLLTDFNITLFFMMVSLFLMISIEVGVTLNDVLKIDTAQNAVLYFLIACFELSYIKYSFARSNDVLEAIFPPIIHKALRGFGLVSPLVLFPQVIPPAMMASAVTSSPSMIAAYNILPSVAGICTVLQDIVLLIAFIVFIYGSTRRTSEEQVDPRFDIICKCGIISSLFCVSTCLVMFLGTGNMGSVELLCKQKIVIAFGLLFGIILVLFVMKILLVLNTRRELRKLMERTQATSCMNTGGINCSGNTLGSLHDQSKSNLRVAEDTVRNLSKATSGWSIGSNMKAISVASIDAIPSSANH